MSTCCDDPGCECQAEICSVCGEELFGFENGPKCSMCEEAALEGAEDFTPALAYEVTPDTFSIAHDGEGARVSLTSIYETAGIERADPTLSRMILCPECGNKRCPRATHHNNACTRSNAPGQAGSNYE